jgi:hypothetical protein
VWPFYSYSNDAATGVLRFTAVCGLFLYLRFACPPPLCVARRTII